ncbi:MAG: bifunctional RNase H/acid phosphatase [Nocardioides sp.]|nr:bifunctional RNase H/acid phosphatase [Nocardioides sp.]
MSGGPRSVVIEADGGSRGNPGPAGYGAVLKDAETGEVIVEDRRSLGVASNNVAEYNGLIGGLRMAAEFAPDANIEVRMDSKLVVEQMSGNWKIKHPDMLPLAAEARQLAPAGTTYTWIPRAQNGHADRLVNEALDGIRDGVTVSVTADPTADPELVEPELVEPELVEKRKQHPKASRGWSGAAHVPTTLILVRHGVTPHTLEKRFSGGLASANPGLSEEGRTQVRATAEWLAPISGEIDAVVASPVRRTMESAEIVGAVLEKRVDVEPGFAEMEFGEWDGMTFTEVAEKRKDELDAWLGNLDVAPTGGESFRQVEERVLEGLRRTLAAHTGRTIVVVSHVTPIKTLVSHALKAPLEAVYRMELTPASVTVLSWYGVGAEADPHASMRLYNARPGEGGFV